MKIGVLQMDVVKGDRQANREKAQRLAAEAAALAGPPDALVLPELWSTGYALERTGELASPLGREDADFLGELARRHHAAFIGGSVLSKQDGKVFNRAQVIDAEGRYVTGYDKIHLFRLMDEHRFLTRGRETCLFSFSGMRCALAICYDIRFCELIRKLAVAGAEALFVSAEWPMVRCDHWETLLRARAIENQMYVVACNRCGGENGELFAGHSMIVAPDGEVLACAGDGEEVIAADLDAERVRRVRESIPVFLDREPELY